MNNLNSVLIEGELAGNPDYRNGNQGNPVCRFTLASSRFFKTDKGIEKETGYYNIEASGKLAVQCKAQGHQGRGVRVVGRLRQEHGMDAGGKPVSRILIDAEHVEFRPGWTQEQKPTVHTRDDGDRGR
jgi:single-strand DNA-binding protein